jgi:uncharacterized protein YjdB
MAVGAAAIAAGVYACGGTEPAPIVYTDHVEVTPTSLQLVIGSEQTVTARCVDVAGAVVAGKTVTWNSVDAAVATVNTSGLVRGVAAGTTTVTATCEVGPNQRQASVSVTVTLPPIVTITVEPPTFTIFQGQKQQVTATPRDQAGNPLSGRTLTWTTSNQAVAIVSSTGEVTALNGGTATITATAENHSGIATGTVPNPVELVIVTPAAGTVSVNRTLQISATTKDAQGVTLTGRPITWASSDLRVATVSSSGLVTGTGVGAVTITATSERALGAAALVVQQAVVLVTLNPSSATLTVGGTQVFQVAAQGAARDTLWGRTATWTSSNTSVATVASGIVTAVAAGQAQITATVEGIASPPATVTVSTAAVATVDVTPTPFSIQVGGSQQLQATPRDAAGVALSGRTVAWTTANAQVATVSSNGAVRGEGTGTATITATVEGKTGTAAATVVQIPVGACVVEPASPVVPLAGFFQLTATPTSLAGAPLAGRVVTWATSNDAVATVSASGLVGGVALGQATITASCEGVPGTAIVTVSNVPAASVSITQPATLRTGESAQLAATVRDASNNVLTGRSVSWTSSSTGVATITTEGLVAAVAPGTSTITATSEGKSGTATLTVVAWPVYTVTVTPAPATVSQGGTVQLTATTRDTLSRVLTGRTVAWTSSNSAVATVSSTGLVTGVTAGSATIAATSEGKSGTSTATVVAMPVATVTLSPTSAALSISGTQQLTATTRDSIGNVLSGRVVSWTSSSAAVATVSSTGLVTGVTAGSTTITATSEGKSGTATVTVSSVGVYSVTVTPATAALAIAQSTQLTATLRDVSNNVLTGRTVTWTTSNVAAATVSTAGLVTGVAAGSATITATSEGKSGTATVTVTSQYTPLKNDTSVWAPNLAAGSTAYYSFTVASARDSVLIYAWATTGATGTVSIKVWDAASSEANPRCAPGSFNLSTFCMLRPGAVGTYYIAVTGVTSITLWGLVAVTYPLVVSRVDVTPSPVPTISIGGTAVLTATPRTSWGLTVTGRTITWSTSNSAVASVTSGGVVTGVAAGTATISATADGKIGTAAVTVQAAPVSTVSVTPLTATISAGGTQQFVATLRDAANNILTGRTVTWSSSNPSAATVSSTGSVTGLGAGTSTITATSEGKSGSASVTVTAVGVYSVTVTWDVPLAGTYPIAWNSGLVFTATSYQHNATARDASLNVLSGRTVTWTSSSTSVATVSATGLVSFLREGTVNITATVEGVSAVKAWTVSSTNTWSWGISNNLFYGIPTTPIDTLRRYYIAVPSGRDSLVVQIVPQTGATGDADLEVYGWPVGGTIATAYSCGSWADGTAAERCRVSLPTVNQYAIKVIAYAAHTGYTVKATYWLGGVPGTAQVTRIPSEATYAGPESAPSRVRPQTQ